MDLDVFTATGFSGAISRIVEKMQHSWFVEKQRERTAIPGFETTATVISRRVPRSIVVPTSG
jgi:hypothetical protein